MLESGDESWNRLEPAQVDLKQLDLTAEGRHFAVELLDVLLALLDGPDREDESGDVQAGEVLRGCPSEAVCFRVSASPAGDNGDLSLLTLTLHPSPRLSCPSDFLLVWELDA